MGIIEYKEEIPGVVRLHSKIEGLLTPARCLEEANKLLKVNNRGNLGYGDSQDLGDSLLFAQEFKDTGIHSVIFSINGRDIIVNKENIEKVTNQMFNSIKVIYGGIGKNLDAIRDAVAELEEKY